MSNVTLGQTTEDIPAWARESEENYKKWLTDWKKNPQNWPDVIREQVNHWLRVLDNNQMNLQQIMDTLNDIKKPEWTEQFGPGFFKKFMDAFRQALKEHVMQRPMSEIKPVLSPDSPPIVPVITTTEPEKKKLDPRIILIPASIAAAIFLLG